MEFEYEQQAMRGEPIPSGIDMASMWMFICLRGLYHQLRLKTIDWNTGAADKKKLVGEYRKWKDRFAFAEKCNARSPLLWKGIEQSANAYQKERTLEHADKLISAIYGVGFPHPEGEVG